MSVAERRVAESPAKPPNAADDPIEPILVWLRREWRDGCRAGNGFRAALGMVGRLRGLAASTQSAAAIDAVRDRMSIYPDLPETARREALAVIAAELTALGPALRGTGAAPQIGKLDGAIAPVRGRTTKRVPVRSTPPASERLALSDEVTNLPRVGPAVAKKLATLDIKRVGDLLATPPRRHIDYSRTLDIGAVLAAGPGSEVTVRGEIVDLREVRGPGAPRVVAKLADESGWVRVTWFNRFLAKQLAVGDEIAVSGKLEAGFGPLSFTSPEWEKIEGDGAAALSTGRLTPVYALTQGLAQKTMRGLTRAALDATRTTIDDFLPDGVRLAPGETPLPPLRRAYEQVHYPDGYAELELAQRRLAFDDLFLLQLGLVNRKRQRQAATGMPFWVDETRLLRFRRGLPFRLTAGQEGALREILDDLAAPRPMARLLQGDVGSGKTVVAAAAILIAHANRLQAALMAPTEILAEQHYHNLRGLFAGLDAGARPRVALLTGSSRAAERRTVVAAVAAGEVDLLVGTHALIQESVEFARLGLSVVDEQHRFGVRQRATLSDKSAGPPPHHLAMTATPIPRTLNMVVNGDLDVSVIAERPPGRVSIETRRYLGAERSAAYDLVRQEVGRGHQGFVICPLVEASAAIEARAAIDEAEWLRQKVFPELRIATLHGRMSGKEKDAVMTAFRDGGFDLLVSTSVIEVGIDVPNATVMVIEGADRFGLAQLHQFRGRVGRGSARSYCLLLAEETSPDGEERLRSLVETDDGFLLAEKDLELRGPGDFIGTRQSGLPAMSWLDGSFDTRLLDRARRAAEAILDRDETLARPEHARLRERLEAFWRRVSPDVPV
jgi:ATP-dependent DNA helicase RecG